MTDLRTQLEEFVEHLATTQSTRIAVEQERMNIVRRLRAILRDTEGRKA